MAIVWTMTLTQPQIQLLKAFECYSDTPKAEREHFGRNFSHFIVHVKPLLREHLVHHETRVIRKKTATQYQIEEQVWTITEKGRNLLRVIEADAREIEKLSGRAISDRLRKEQLPGGADAD